MIKRRLGVFILLMSFVFILTNGPLVLAQGASDKNSKKSDEVTLEEIVVTGSRIAREKGFGQTSPVTVIGKEDITSFGLTRIEDVLNTMPQLETSQNATISNGATGTAELDLRGLGPERTLVLMNGRRLQPGGTYTQIVDVNQIPAAMVERVEVLTGGASAVYGADAVAGVVNFIMRKVQGVELSLGASAYQHNNNNSYIQGLMNDAGYSYPSGDSGFDGSTYNVDLLAGSDFGGGRGNATVYATYRKNKALLEGARDYSSCALNSAGTACGGSSTAPNPNFFIYPMVPDAQGTIDNVNWNDEWWATLQPDSSLADFDGTNVYNYAPVNNLMRPDERWSAGAFLDYDINEKATAYMEIQWFKDHSKAQIAQSGTFYVDEILPLDNTLFPDTFRASLEARFPGQQWFDIEPGKRNVEGGPRYDMLDHASFRIVAGLKGAFTDNWNYDAYYLKGMTTSSSTYINDIYSPALTEPMYGQLCAADSSCIPYNVFTYNGVTTAAAQGLGGVGISDNHTSIQMWSGSVNGNTGFGLPAGNIQVAAGIEWREETYEDIRDTVYADGLLLGQGGSTPSLSGAFNVWDVFGEADVPLLADMPFIKNLTMNLALRYSDHDITKGQTTYRVGLDWNTNDILRFRMGYNRAIRSPNIEEFFSSNYIGLWNGVDPCAGATPEYSVTECARTGMTAAQYGNVTANPAEQYNKQFGGNPNLEPEKADTYTFGIVVQPSNKLKFSVDYWNIKIDNTIDEIGAELIVNICASEGKLCDMIHRLPNGSLWQNQAGYVVDTYQNIGKQKWEGVDLAGTYWLDAMSGTFNFNIIGTYMMKKQTTPIAADPSTAYDCNGIISGVCFPSPKWRHTATVTYDSHGFWTATARWRYYSHVGYDGTTDKIVDLTATSYFDLSTDLKLFGNSDLFLGVNNVFDNAPPLVGSGLSGPWGNANAIAGYYDTLGRFFFSRLTFRF